VKKGGGRKGGKGCAGEQTPLKNGSKTRQSKRLRGFLLRTLGGARGEKATTGQMLPKTIINKKRSKKILQLQNCPGQVNGTPAGGGSLKKEKERMPQGPLNFKKTSDIVPTEGGKDTN